MKRGAETLVEAGASGRCALAEIWEHGEPSEAMKGARCKRSSEGSVLHGEIEIISLEQHVAQLRTSTGSSKQHSELTGILCVRRHDPKWGSDPNYLCMCHAPFPSQWKHCSLCFVGELWIN